MASVVHASNRLAAKRREQTPQALARLTVAGLFIGLWFVLWLARIPMPVPFLIVLLVEALFFVAYWRIVFVLPNVRSVELAQYGMLASEIVFHTTMVYFLGTVSWLGAFAYVFGLIFANTFLDLRRGLVYTTGASLAFIGLILLEANGVVPHYVYLEQGPLRHTDAQFVATTAVGGIGVFFSIYGWVNWVGHQLRQERDAAVRSHEDLLQARAQLQRANEELEERVKERTAELEEANASLHESQERLRTVVTNAPIVLFALDQQGVFTLLEGKGLEAIGVEPERILGRPMTDVFQGAPEVVQDIRSALAGTSLSATVELAGRSLETHYTPVTDASGEPAGIIGIASDITERVRAETALRESEERYRSLYTKTPGMLHSINEDGRLVDVSDHWLAVLGYQRGEVIGRKAVEFLTEESRRYAETVALPEFMETGYVGDIAYQFVKKNGEIVDILLSAVSERDNDGNFSRGFAILTDVTERKRAEEALRQSEERYRWLIESAPDAMVIVNEQGDMVMINTETEKLFGYSRDELLGKSVELLIPERFRGVHVGHRADYVTTRERRLMGAGHSDLPGLRKDGSEFATEISLSLLETDEGLLVTATIRDITERKRAEDDLKERVRQDPLTGVLNHGAIVDELRSLLAEGATADCHAVAMVDVDGMKVVNDTYGHLTGDDVLKTVAAVLSQDGAIVGRYGGDEFVVVLRGTDRRAAERYRHAVLDELLRSDVRQSKTTTNVPIVASIGFAIYPEEAEAVGELIKLADSAMYAARRQRPIDTSGLTPLRDERAAQMVGEIVPLLTSAGDLEDKLRLVSQRLSIGAGYDAVNFALIEPVSGERIANNTVADAPEHLVDAWIQEQRNENTDRHPIFPFLERTRQPVIIDDPWNSELLTQPQRDILRAADLKTVLVAPMFWQDQLVGTLGVASKRELAFTSRDTQFLAAVATQVTAIVRMATLVDELQTKSTSIGLAQDATVMLLASAAEARDETTGHHLQSVRALTEALASELGYGDEGARELGLAAVLHDIGKIRTPDAILSSTGSLTDREREVMEHHAVWGAQLLEGHPGFELAASVAPSHHERWDGAGYPDGLSGDAIPEAAAIVTVADSFDAMISDRPYRKGRPVAEAIREIAAGSGTQFSPKVAATLLRLHKQGRLPSRSSMRPPSRAA